MAMSKNELAEATASAEELKTVKTVELSSGDTMELDFSRITGRVLLKADTDTRKEDPTISVMALSQAYQARVASAAAGVKYDDILDLPGGDFTAVMLQVQSFLISSGQ